MSQCPETHLYYEDFFFEHNTINCIQVQRQVNQSIETNQCLFCWNPAQPPKRANSLLQHPHLKHFLLSQL